MGRVALLQTSKLAVADPQQANNFNIEVNMSNISGLSIEELEDLQVEAAKLIEIKKRKSH